MRYAIIVLLVAARAPASATEPSPKEIRAAVEKALPLLQKGAAGHMANRTCFACHNQALPVLALTKARERGLPVDAAAIDRNLKFIAAFLDRNRENYRKGAGQGGAVDTAGYALWTLALGSWKSDPTTDAVSEYLLLFQKGKDHWQTNTNRPPSETSPFTTSYLALRSLQAYGHDDQKARINTKLNAMRRWLTRTPAKDTEDRVFRLRALQIAGCDANGLQGAANELLATQRDDGGWGQLDRMESDAYATGSALVALHEAGGLATDDAAYKRGVAYLLSTQKDDGSWYVKSRSKPFQLYFETGFPHAKDQFISSAASGWAATALVLALPEIKASRAP